MRQTIRATLLILLVFLFTLVPLQAENLPKYRPAMLARSSRSLVNLINAESLMKRGQKDAIVLFSVGVTNLGFGFNMQVYRGSPNSELLKKEILGYSRRAEYEPAVYDHVRRTAYIDGTVSFFIVNGKPHIRVFLHQEEADFQKGADFIAPQLTFLPGNPQYEGFRYPPSALGYPGVGSVRVDLDADGKVKGAKVVYEHPPGVGFGAAAAGPLAHAIFIPGFKNGKPVACQFTFSVIFPGPGREMRTG